MREPSLYIILALVCGGSGLLLLLASKLRGITIEEEDAEALDALSWGEKPYTGEDQ